MNIRYFLLFLLTILFLIFGCSTSEKVDNNSLKEFPINLYVGNQSYDSEPVHLFVKIMGHRPLKENETNFEKIIVDEDFNNIAMLSPKYFTLSLQEGTYIFWVEANQRSYIMSVVFEVDKPLLLKLSYMAKNHIGLSLEKNRPVIFGYRRFDTTINHRECYSSNLKEINYKADYWYYLPNVTC